MITKHRIRLRGNRNRRRLIWPIFLRVPSSAALDFFPSGWFHWQFEFAQSMVHGVKHRENQRTAPIPGEPASPVVEVSGLTINRDGILILDRVDWRVGKGEHWVILGANGSGKSSLLSALTGYLVPSGGEIRLLGEVYGESDWRELRKCVGLVSSSLSGKFSGEDTALETVLTGKSAMIEHWGRVSKRDRERAMAMLGRAGCLSLAKRPWRVLSQGERQRVLIARALMPGPALLILDEPCAGLDPVARAEFLEFLGDLVVAESSPTVVLVTHHVEEIGPAFSHVLLLRRGEVLAAGPRRKILTSRLLTLTFASPVRLREESGRLSLIVRRVSPPVG